MPRFAAALLIVGLCTFSALAQEQPAQPEKTTWKPLFDGKTLEGWKATNFGGEGEVRVEEGVITMEYGSSLTGITWKGEFPTTNYELHVVAQRAEGSDFFAGVTFPVGESYCSFIPGGWGGTVMGLSSIDDYDASENATTQFLNVKAEKWYDIRIRVTPAAIQVWLDDKRVINQELEGHKISIRPEVEPSCPLGISAFETKAKIKTIEYRLLADDKKASAPAPPEK